MTLLNLNLKILKQLVHHIKSILRDLVSLVVNLYSILVSQKVGFNGLIVIKRNLINLCKFVLKFFVFFLYYLFLLLHSLVGFAIVIEPKR
jgi:hypothetical protein